MKAVLLVGFACFASNTCFAQSGQPAPPDKEVAAGGIIVRTETAHATAAAAVAQADARNGGKEDESAAIRITVKDGVIHCFPDGVNDGVITHCQIEGRKLWVDAIRRGGKTRQIRVTSYVGNDGTLTPVKLFCPETTDGTITWNMPVKRDGDIVSSMLPWNGVLIGDLMDVNEGAEAANTIRKKLGTTSGIEGAHTLLFSSGDSIAMGYWPYLEAEMLADVDVYYQQEVCKDIPEVKLKSGGNAHVANLAYGFLETAYKNDRFKPDYLLMNFGLHMIATHSNKIDEYGQWIEKIDDLAKQHGAQLIWVMTTPYEQSFRPTQNQVVIKFNEAAKAVAKQRGIPVVDLHACTLAAVKELGNQKTYEDGVHFQDDVRKRQAVFIATRVREIITAKNPK